MAQGSGISSESIWTPFDSLTTASIREVVGKVFIAWTRVSNVDNFATIGGSQIGGTDIIRGLGDVALNDVDAFEYFDETDNVLRIEYERNLIEPLGGMTQAIADVVLDNTDLRFTPNYNATIGTALRPNRPIKLFIGFHVRGQDKVIPIIEGLTLQPKENKERRTVTITAYDYLRWLNEKPQETTMYQDQRSDQIIADILSRAGVGSSSYSLDQGLNTIGFAWFEKGQTAGERIKKICEAEEAIFYQDEAGVLRFETRDKYNVAPYTSSVWTIDPDDILQWENDFASRIINRVIVSGKPRSVKAEAEVWRDGLEEEIDPSQSIVVWASFEDPVSSATSPVQDTDFKAFTGTGSTGTDISSDIDVTMELFTKDAKLTITNNNASKAYMPLLKIRGTPATVDYSIREIFQDTTSITDFNEQQKTINNEFIDDRNFAANMAQNIVRRHRNQTSIIRITVKGIPQLQLRDMVRVKDLDLDTYTNYRVIGIQGVFEGGAFTQTLRLREVTTDEKL